MPQPRHLARRAVIGQLPGRRTGRDIAAQVDHEIGRFLDALAVSPLGDRTTVVFLSDNGAEGSRIDTIRGVPDPAKLATLPVDNSFDNLGAGSSHVGYGPGWASVHAPMGGYKESGVGRRHGVDGILKFTESQTVSTTRLINLGGRRLPPKLWARLRAMRRVPKPVRVGGVTGGPPLSSHRNRSVCPPAASATFQVMRTQPAATDSAP